MSLIFVHLLLVYIKSQIPVIADLPVGRNLQEHPSFALNAFFDSTDGLDAFDFRSLNTPWASRHYSRFGKGPKAACPTEVMALFNATENGEPVYHKPTEETKWPDIEVVIRGTTTTHPLQDDRANNFVHYYFGTNEKMKGYYNQPLRKGLGFNFYLLHPKSTGRITLASADPLERPLIDLNMYSDERDRSLFRAGFKFAMNLISTESLRKYQSFILDQKYPTRDRIAPNADPFSDEYIDEYIASVSRTVWHPAGTCKMGAIGDKTAVVDSQLRVQGGIEGLRVVDNSIMPHQTSGNTNAPAIMIGEKASDLILNSYR